MENTVIDLSNKRVSQLLGDGDTPILANEFVRRCK
jgi:hypothetical protein